MVLKYYSYSDGHHLGPVGAQRGDVKLCWDWGRKRNCSKKEIYRGLEPNLTVEFVLNKHRRGKGEWEDTLNRRNKASLQRYRGGPCQTASISSYLWSLRDFWLQVKLGR